MLKPKFFKIENNYQFIADSSKIKFNHILGEIKRVITLRKSQNKHCSK